MKYKINSIVVQKSCVYILLWLLVTASILPQQHVELLLSDALVICRTLTL